MRRIWVMCVLLSAFGCDGESPAMDAGTDRVDAAPAPDAGPPAEPDAGDPPAPDAAAGMTGGLAGVVTRTAMPRAGGVGHLYLAVFDRDPVTNRDTAMVVGRVIVEDADMSSADAAIPYAIDGIPPRAEPYFVSGFLDDNMNAGTDPETAGPDRGDLVTLEGFGSPTVTVSSAETVAYDIVLNTNLPF
ncbi:MAG: hypothetical protein RLO52_26805 [Sandaracinaceae bacterium]